MPDEMDDVPLTVQQRVLQVRPCGGGRPVHLCQSCPDPRPGQRAAQLLLLPANVQARQSPGKDATARIRSGQLHRQRRNGRAYGDMANKLTPAA